MSPIGESDSPNCRIEFSSDFERDVASLKRRYHQLHANLLSALAAIERDPRGPLCKRIPGYTNLFKIRVRGENSGKRGGFRLIYHHEEALVIALRLYSKSDTEDLTRDEIVGALRRAGLI